MKKTKQKQNKKQKYLLKRETRKTIKTNKLKLHITLN